MEEKRTAAIFGKVEPDLSAAQPSAAGTGSILDALRSKLWNGRWLLLWTVVAFSLVAMMLGSLQPTLYKVQSSLVVQSPERRTQSAKIADPENGQLGELFLQTQIRVIESRSLVERVLAKMSDTERARLFEAPHFWWSSSSYSRSLESLRQHISARPSEQAGIVDVSFLSPDASAGAHFLNLLTRELADLNVERAWHTVQHNRQWTERQVDELRRKWEQSEQVLLEYSQTAGVKAAHPEPAEPVAVKVSTAGNGTALRQLRTKLADTNKQIVEWEALYGPSGAKVQELKAEAAQTEAAIRQQSSRAIAAPRAEPATQLPVSGPVSAAPAQTTAHLRALREEADSNRALYETTSTRLKEAGIASASQPGEISVVDPAVPVAASQTPSQWLTGTLGAFTGLLVGVAFVALRDRFSSTFSDPAFASHYLGVPLLGAVPVDRFAHQKTYNPVTQEPGLHLDFETDARSAEAFRSIRASILLGTSQRSGPRRILFISAGPGEGKTLVVANLGAALASAQRRVLLVDGNLRNPRLHKVFGADNDHGLADLLDRQISEHPVGARDVIRETQIPDLYLLSAGEAGSRGPEVLSSPQLPQLIREFAKGFDIVLLDSPPVLPYADARSLARAADAAVMIVKAGVTGRHLATLARDAISQDGTPVIGAILTEWDAQGDAASV